MPTYDYFCDACSHEEEVFQKITADALKTCPRCSQESYRRRPSGGIGLAFKGDGFYTNTSHQHPKATSSSTEGGGCCPCGKNKCS